MDEKEAEARPVMGTIFLVIGCLWETIQKVRMSKNAWAKLRGPNTCMLKVCFGRLKPNLKQTELQKSKNRGKKCWIRAVYNHWTGLVDWTDGQSFNHKI